MNQRPSPAMIAPLLHWEIKNGTIQSGKRYSEASIKILMEEKFSTINGVWSLREYKDALRHLHGRNIMKMYALVPCATQHGCQTINDIEVVDHHTLDQLDGHHHSCHFCGEALVHLNKASIEVYYSIGGPAPEDEVEEASLSIDGSGGFFSRLYRRIFKGDK